MAEVIVPIFRVENAREVAGWYARLGFEKLDEHQFEPGFPLYVFLQRGDVYLHLSEHTGDAPPESLAYLYVDELASIAEEFGVAVTKQPWGPELELVDPCGNRMRVGVVPSLEV